MTSSSIKAVILDLDGVVTRTASLHAKAWKQVFDKYLEHRRNGGESEFQAFDPDADYRRYVDGKPRYQGVRSFLESRGVELPWGESDDDPGWGSICAIGNRKNEIFHGLLNREGAEVFEDAVEKIRDWRRKGFQTAVVSSSKNCGPILRSTGLESLFDVRVDGVTAEEENLKGKAAPDIFRHAAGRLNVRPEEALMAEDAQAGVQAGRSGDFGLVVGVARDAPPETLRGHGADVTVRSFDDIDLNPDGTYAVHPAGLPSALQKIDGIRARIRNTSFALFLDYDGTLTPIVKRPEQAVLSEKMRSILKRAASAAPTAVVSGRDLDTVRGFIQLDELIYAGSHGFDILLPDGGRKQNEEARAALPDLDRAEQRLRNDLNRIPGAQVERKRFAVAVHYRNADKTSVPRIRGIVDTTLSEYGSLEKGTGKKVLELRPAVDWDKGKAVGWLLGKIPHGSGAVPVYVGDDITDEDAFLALQGKGVGVLVGDHGGLTAARYRLQNVDETARFLEMLIQ